LGRGGSTHHSEFLGKPYASLDDNLHQEIVLWSISMYTDIMDLTKAFMSKRVSDTRNWKYQRNSIAKKRPAL